ncbi:cold-shock protein [Azospirillum halopraeferens]|uniref:cold-shock protein n=1 Tax=Azospirillum halopraeferens TaxID=34010 RepID=UPI0003F4EE46|nr:cold-shock protein [Azospirillum halopraeferens]
MRQNPPRHIYRQQSVIATGAEGTVKWFDPVRGFGFVKMSDGSSDALLPGAVVQAAGHATLPEGATVTVDLVEGRKGAQVSALHGVDRSTAAPPPAPRAPRPGRPERAPYGADRSPRRNDRPAAAPVGAARPRPAPRDVPAGPTTEVDGTVKWYNTAKGFGFVGPDDGGRDVFVHVSALERAGLRTLAENQRVRLTVRQGQKGPEAVSVAVL